MNSPSSKSLSSRRASRLSRRSCFSISALMRFCSLASSDWQHCMVMLLVMGPLSYHPRWLDQNTPTDRHFLERRPSQLAGCGAWVGPPACSYSRVGAEFDPVKVSGLTKPHPRPPVTGLGRSGRLRAVHSGARLRLRIGPNGATQSAMSSTTRHHSRTGRCPSILYGNCTDALCTFTTNPFHTKQQPPLVNMALPSVPADCARRTGSARSPPNLHRLKSS